VLFFFFRYSLWFSCSFPLSKFQIALISIQYKSFLLLPFSIGNIAPSLFLSIIKLLLLVFFSFFPSLLGIHKPPKPAPRIPPLLNGLTPLELSPQVGNLSFFFPCPFFLCVHQQGVHCSIPRVLCFKVSLVSGLVPHFPPSPPPLFS